MKQEKRLNYYWGSLDWSCDFCNSSSYRNFQLSKTGKKIDFVVCEECLEKAKNRDTKI